MYSIKEQLLSCYLNSIEESDKITPLRSFIDSIGLDWRKMNRKQLMRWSTTKRYKDYFALNKIKKIADTAHSTNEESISFSQLMEKVKLPPSVKVIKPGRGHYKSIEQRKRIYKSKIMDVINSGGAVSGAGGEILFAGTGRGKQTKKALGGNRVILKKKVRTPTGMRYHRKVLVRPGGGKI